MMKRSLGSSDSLGALISICPSTDDPSPAQEQVYSSRDEWGGVDDEQGAIATDREVREKKRRLSGEQVKALEKHFEVENKLEPERKTKLAQELGLQPRQVAVWFQNRRARWKTKQLEKDYGLLKASFDSLQREFHSLHQHNDSLKLQIRDLQSKLGEDTTAADAPVSVSVKEEEEVKAVATTESDSSAVLNSSPSNDDGGLTTYFNLSEEAVPLVKLEEHDFLGEEGCNFFPEDEAPSLHWYCGPDDEWTS